MSEEAVFNRLAGRVTAADADRIDFNSMEVEDINMDDFPDFCNAYCATIYWKNGVEFTDTEIDDFNDVFYEDVSIAIHENQLYL